MKFEERLSKGQVSIWYYFDEGNCPGSRVLYTIVINGNSHFKDGAWEFIEYLLNVDIQSTFDYAYLPVQRSGLDELISKEIEEGSLAYYMDGGLRLCYTMKAGLAEYETTVGVIKNEDAYCAAHDMTEEKGEGIRQLLEITKHFRFGRRLF